MALQSSEFNFGNAVIKAKYQFSTDNMVLLGSL